MRYLTRGQKTLFFFALLAVYVLVVSLLLRDRYLNFAAEVDRVPAPVTVTHPVKDDSIVLPPLEDLPAEKTLDVPFLVQAPFGVWDELHGEACEEASLMMVRYFLQNKRFDSLEAADQEIKDLVAWQSARNYKVDISVAEVAEVARDYYQLSDARIIDNPTVNDIKREIAAGRPVIIPAAGRLLGNPYFTAPGPPYHMLVIRGYTDTGFIANDPGTRRGEAFRYTHDQIMNAIHDWNGSIDTITTGPSRVLVFD